MSTRRASDGYDIIAAATTVCRDSADVCDAAEFCTGTGAVCPVVDAGVTCPDAETCDGTTGNVFTGQCTVEAGGCATIAAGEEECGDLKDNNCDGQTDEGCGLLLDHYLSYSLKDKAKGKPKIAKGDRKAVPKGFTVQLEDQFHDLEYEIKKLKELLVPTKKEHEPEPNEIADEITHLLSYHVKASQDVPMLEPTISVISSSQFGDVKIKLSKRADRLLVPSDKRLDEPIDPIPDLGADHFICYQAKETEPVEPITPEDFIGFFDEEFHADDSDDDDDDGDDAHLVRLTNQFEIKTYVIGKVKRFCVPVDKNDEGINDEERHLTCYSVKLQKQDPKQAKHEPTLVHLRDQFGDGQQYTKKEKELCVPSTKTVLP